MLFCSFYIELLRIHGNEQAIVYSHPCVIVVLVFSICFLGLGCVECFYWLLVWWFYGYKLFICSELGQILGKVNASKCHKQLKNALLYLYLSLYEPCSKAILSNFLRSNLRKKRFLKNKTICKPSFFKSSEFTVVHMLITFDQQQTK